MLRVGLAFVLSIACANAQRCGNTGGTPGVFDYYVLALSWAPGFCDTSTHPSASECGSGRHLGFVVHGLWPQIENGRSPEACTSARPVSHDQVDRILQLMPDRGLVQHEWACHGTCSGLPVQDYFRVVESAFRAVRPPQLPPRIRVRDLEQKFADANRTTPDSFRAVCHGGELVEVRVCLTKDLKFRACSASVRECPANEVMVAPVP
jgi:ribonuclease T2